MRRPAPSLRSRRAVIIAVVAVVVALIVLGALATFYTDLLWFREVGFTSVFWAQIGVKIGLGAVFAAVFAVVLVLNLWIVRRITTPGRLFTVSDQILERYRTAIQPYVGWAVVGMAVVFGLFAGSGASSKWREWILFRNAVDFGQTDPVFQKDIGFFVFRLPFHRFLFTWSFASLIVITLIVAGAHYFMGGIRPAVRGERVAPEVRVHLSVLGAVLVLLKAWSYRLDQFNLLYSPRGTVTGASYTDVNAQLPALRLLVIIALIVVVLFLANIRFRASIIPLAAIGLLFVTSILAGGIYPAIVQRLRVTPVERIRERPFIARNISATRDAFGISDEDVAVRSFPARPTLTPAQAQANADTIQNIRLWAPNVIIESYRQLQRIKQYYEFDDIDVDRYTIGGQRRQVMLAAREISQRGLQAGARTWVNTHLVYTHGFGLVTNLVSRVTEEGQPDFVLQDIPPQSAAGFPAPEQPRIYFGESQDTPFVVVKTEEDELDFPKGETFERTRYAGEGGVKLGSFFRRAAFAWRFRDVNLVISGALRSDSRIIFRRRIEDRLRQVAPFLKFDSDPYIANINGRLTWIADAYTTTDMFPYSERIGLTDATGGNLSGMVNYMRNAVKATVDAFDGTITLYVWDESDPVIRAWRKAFPKIFRPRSQMSPGLLSHVRYPEDLFRVQTDRYSTYHITNADDFYSKEDAWAIAKDPTDQAIQSANIEPYYVLMRLPGERSLQFILIRPFTPNQRQNMTAWLAARSDAQDYGELISFVFPRERVSNGPEQVFARINQDPEFSKERSLLGQGGSRVVFGNLLVIPIQESLLYVQPVYVVGAQSQLPELKRVVLVSGSRVQVGENLENALDLLFGRAPPPEEEAVPRGETVASLLQEALVHYDRSQEALRRGDFTTYGREQRAMKRALDEAAQASGASPSPSPSPRPSPS